MDKSTLKLLGTLLTVAVVLGIYLLIPRWHSRQVRQSAYKRYATLGESETIRQIVDRNHKEVFEQCYRPGARRRKAEFDVEKYARLMDAKVEGALGRMVMEQKLAAHEALQEERRQQRAAVPPPAASTPPPTPAARPHVVEIRSLSAKRITDDATTTAFAGATFRVEVDVADAQNDVVGAGANPTRFTVKCQNGGTYSTDRPAADSAASSTSPPEAGARRLAYRLLIPDTTVGRGIGLCELLAQVHDTSGNVSNERRVFIALR
jgi:hypothetical protein